MRSIFPASILDKSSMSLIIWSKVQIIEETSNEKDDLETL